MKRNRKWHWRYRGPRWRSHGVHAPSRVKLINIAKREWNEFPAPRYDDIIDSLVLINEVFNELPCMKADL